MLSRILPVFVALATGSAAVKAPPLPPPADDSEQGLILTVRAGDRTDTRAARLASLYVPKGEPVTPFLPAGAFTATWTGEINSPLRSEYTFAAEVRGVVKVSIGGEQILEGAGDTTAQQVSKKVQLNKGGSALVVEFSSDGRQDAMLQFKWWSDEFPEEPVPPTEFTHDPANETLREGMRVREGRMLFAQLRCTACHEAADLLPAPGAGMPELSQDAPVFDEPGAKHRENFLAHWIADPHAIRPNALMPRAFTPGKEGEVDQRAADLAAYFASVGKPDEGKLAPENAPLGGALFANLGCIACHTTPDFEGQDEEHRRVPLSHVSAKWVPKALVEFLQNPSKNYASIRMPNFRLTEEEATRLAAYLIENSKREFSAAPKGDAARGAQILATSGCLNCHAGMPPVTQPKLAQTLESGWLKGCLAEDAKDRGAAPDFALTPEQRGALLAFAATDFSSLKQFAPVEYAEREIRNLRCTACHERDGKPSAWSELESEMIMLTSAAPSSDAPVEGGPVATTALPPMTWFGEKLQPDWMAKFIAGHAGIKPRPWIVARMPGFEKRAEGIATGLPLEHGLPVAVEPVQADAEKAEIGKQLIGATGGFNCIQCHAIGEQAATAVFEAPGVDFAYAKERLRQGYYARWVLAPQRADPETKMPKFADAEGKTPLTQHYDGDAAKQFDAIWHFLQTIRK